MPYLGNNLATQFQAFTTQTITGDGSTGYTLDKAVANGKEILVYINNVKQEEGSGKAYTASGTTITFSEAVASTDTCYVVYLGSAIQTVNPPDASVGSSQLASSIDFQNITIKGGSNTAITVDSSGRMQLPQLVHFHGNRTGLSVEARGGNVNYNVVRDNYSGWNSSNHQYTIPVTGVYHFGFTNIGKSSVSSSAQNHALQFVRGGSTTTMAIAYQTDDVEHESVALSVTYYLQANDLVQMNNFGGVVYNGNYSTFSICLMG